jgi:hypothetical protein
VIESLFIIVNISSLTTGYRITVVGHSLGAGVASIIAAEMRSTVSLSGVGSGARRRRSQQSEEAVGLKKSVPIDLTGNCKLQCCCV